MLVKGAPGLVGGFFFITSTGCRFPSGARVLARAPSRSKPHPQPGLPRPRPRRPPSRPPHGPDGAADAHVGDELPRRHPWLLASNAVAAGARALVAGSAVFKGASYAENIAAIRAAAD